MDRKIEDIYLIHSDMHMGEGRKNNLEYFEADKEFIRAIGLAVKKYHKHRLTLCLLGDTFDFLAVAYESETHAEPGEEAAIFQIRQIWKAHRAVFAILRTFLRCGGTIKFFIGNHDLALVWPNVQNFIRRKLTKYMSWPQRINIWDKRIKFLFEEKRDGVYLNHGNNAEALHATPKNVFLTKRMGKPLLLRLLRHPYGNHVRDLANTLARGSKICKGNYWVGRLEPHKYVYLESIWKPKNWWFAINAIFLWLILPLRHRISARWWIRKSAGIFTLFWYNIQTLIWTIFNTIHGKDYTEYPKEILKDNNDIDIIILGHIHICRREMHEKYGTYIYVGNWSTVYDVQWPRPNLKWKRFRRLERFVKGIMATRLMFNKKTRELYAPRRRELYSFCVCKFFDDGYKEIELLKYNKQNDKIEEQN